MKTLFFLCGWLPLTTAAQSDTLKPIGMELVPLYNRYQSVTTQYTYDGLDVRAKDLRPYIMASGKVAAMREYQRYINSRKMGAYFIVFGLLASVASLPVGYSREVMPPARMPGAQLINGMWHANGQMYTSNPNDGPVVQTKNGGVLMLAAGVGLLATGILLHTPGLHVRRAVQLYNRGLRQRSVSWQWQPFAPNTLAGAGLIGRF